MSVLDKFLDAIRLNDDYEEEDADSDSFFDEEEYFEGNFGCCVCFDSRNECV